MKTKNSKNQSYLRAHHRGLMTLSLVVMLICLAKFDSHLLAVFRQAYNQGFGIIGTYMREGEMTRYPIDFGVARIQTTSGM
ncbi:MAG TPA: hypothetical protein VLG11_04345 [Candidatus Saccharimonadales bacterium]|nr:hypothetical protein [Candidatus Saccharimonadales bacterium]